MENKQNGQTPIDQLSINQYRWLANRAWHETDTACLEALKLGASTVTRWRADSPVFVEAEKSIWRGDLRRSQEMMARIRDKAVLKLERLLDSRDARVARAAAVDVLDRAGLNRGDVVTVEVSPALAKLLAESEKPSSGETDG